MLSTFALVLAVHGPQGQDRLVIDPLLIAMAAEVWSVAAGGRQLLWPGWDASATPLLFYMPNEQEVLINHPSPPDGFRRLRGVPGLPFDNIYVRDGETLFGLDGQNTTREVNGVRTLVVSDTLSQRRQWLQGLVEAAKGGAGDATEQINAGMRPNPYGLMGMIAHEAFHAFQEERASNKGVDELALFKYPALSAENNAGFAIEAELLRDSLLAEDGEGLRSAAIKWMALRHGRRKGLPEECAAYEDGTEFGEGLAKSMEYRLLRVLEGRTPVDRMYWAQGFHGYGDLSKERQRLIDDAIAFMSGARAVNNDLYGASPVRFRLYYSGMLIAALLDRLDPAWKTLVFEPERTLTGLARRSLDVTDAELDRAYDEIKLSERYVALLAQKSKLAADGARHAEGLMTELRGAPATLVIDATEWAGKPVGVGMTPFGILRVDDEHRFYRMIPFRARMGAFQLAVSDARPVYHDDIARQYVVGLLGTVDAAALDGQLGKEWRDGPIDLSELRLPGATLKGGRVSLTLAGSELKVRVHFQDRQG